MRQVRLITTKVAEHRLSQLENPLDIQMELLFSCLIRKRVLFRKPEGVAAHPMAAGDERVDVCFTPVMTKVCPASDVDDLSALELVDFPVQRVEAFMPRWLRIDFHDGRWHGDFGWVEQ